MNRYYGQNGALLCSETHDEMTAVDKDVYKDIGNSEALKKNRTNNSSVIVSSSTRGICREEERPEQLSLGGLWFLQ